MVNYLYHPSLIMQSIYRLSALFILFSHNPMGVGASIPVTLPDDLRQDSSSLSQSISIVFPVGMEFCTPEQPMEKSIKTMINIFFIAILYSILLKNQEES